MVEKAVSIKSFGYWEHLREFRLSLLNSGFFGVDSENLERVTHEVKQHFGCLIYDQEDKRSYLSAEASKLYGKSGHLRIGFNHELLAAELKNCPHDWLMTIDNSPRIVDLYSWANFHPGEKLYSMTNVDGRKSKGGKELLVASFKIATTGLSDTTSKAIARFGRKT
jgi:hypothetical protein